jgi:Yip1-like protein
MSMVESAVSKGLIERVKNICVSPSAEWMVIEGESASTASLITGYVVPLAVVSAVAAFIGSSIIGVRLPFIGGTYRVPLVSGLVMVVLRVAFTAIGVVVCGMVIDALAPSFGAQKNSLQATKVAAYAPTAAWVAGILQIIPALGALSILGALYSLYVLYLGLPRLMKAPEDKAVGYTVVVVITVIVIGVVISFASAAFMPNPLAGTNLVQ